MNFKKLIDKFIKDNPKSTMPDYKHRINALMGKYNVKYFNDTNIFMILAKFDHMTKEQGYVIAKPQLLAIAETYSKQNINMRKVFNVNSSTLYKILNQEKVSIDYAIGFCKLNKLRLSDNFTVYSVKKVFSIEVKENTKCRIRQLFEYAVAKGYIDQNPLPKKYRFVIDQYRRTQPLSKSILKSFVHEVFNYPNINGRNIIIIYLLVNLNKKIMKELTIKNIEFQKNRIIYQGKIYPMSAFISDYLFDYFGYEDENNKILTTKTSSYLKTIIYRLRDRMNCKDINIETLTKYHTELINQLNSYTSTAINRMNFKDKGLDSLKDYNDFKEFMRLRNEYEEAIKNEKTNNNA